MLQIEVEKKVPKIRTFVKKAGTKKCPDFWYTTVDFFTLLANRLINSRFVMITPRAPSAIFHAELVPVKIFATLK